MTRAAELAGFLADNPALVGSAMARAIHLRWGMPAAAEAEEAIAILTILPEARASTAKTELQRLIEMTRLVHGSATAASIIERFQLQGDSDLSAAA